MLPSGGGATINCSDSSAGQVKGPVSFHCRLYFRETFPLLNDGAKSSAELLPEEEKRLSDIAEILKEAEGAQFLVEGHTASTGNLKGEKQLSEDRANAIAQKLSSKGISSGRFITKGSGGTKPVADNSTAEGKAANRRVEITIL